MASSSGNASSRNAPGLPTATAGVALGLCGAGSIAGELHRLWGGPDGTLVFTWAAVFLWLPFTMSRIANPRGVAAELLEPSHVAAYATYADLGFELAV